MAPTRRTATTLLSLVVAAGIGYTLGSVRPLRADTPAKDKETAQLAACRDFVDKIFKVGVMIEDDRLAKMDKFAAEQPCSAIVLPGGSAPPEWNALGLRFLGTLEYLNIISRNTFVIEDLKRLNAAFDVRAKRLAERASFCIVNKK